MKPIVNARQGVILALLALLAAALATIALRTRQPPRLPANATHVFVDAATCLGCHGPDGARPRGKNHPLGNDCLRCHGRRGG